MRIFKYEPVAVKVNDSYRNLYAKIFETHAQWLANNDIVYQVAGFRWPELVTMLRSRNIVIEFEISIDDDTDAMMFRLFSGMAND